MRQLMRLVRYVLPFLVQLLPGVFLLAGVGFLEACRLMLLKPVLDRVLNPASGSENIILFTNPQTGNPIYLQQFVPTYFHNAWTIVAYALVAATVLKGGFDYAGTYLVNHAGFGMITNLRNDLYNSVLRRSVAFFQKHTTGTLISTIINDIERVQFAMSTVLAEGLQQFFTFLFTAGLVIVLGRKLAWVLVVFIPIIIFSDPHWTAGSLHHTHRTRSTGRRAEYPARDHYRQPNRQSIWHGILGSLTLPQSGAAALSCEFAISRRRRDQFAADGCVRRHCCCFVAAPGPRSDRA